MNDLRIAVVPGDGIGVEVIREACAVLEAVAAASGRRVALTPFDWSADAYLKTGVSLPKDEREVASRWGLRLTGGDSARMPVSTAVRRRFRSAKHGSSQRWDCVGG